jgi:hypothetical protein
MALLNTFIEVGILCLSETVLKPCWQEKLRFYPAEAFTEPIVVHDTVIHVSESITTSTGVIWMRE